MMNSVILQSNDMVRTDVSRRLSMISLVQRLKKLTPGYNSRPAWAHVPNRTWRRNSALLTYLHEAQTGSR